MGLFTTLTSQASETVTKTSSLDLPTVTQLYHSSPLKLESTAQLPTYALLSYSAVPVTLLSDNDEIPTPRNGSKKNITIIPELGVWNCCVSKRGSDAPLLVPQPPKTVVLTVDLSKSSHVEPTLTLLQDALVRSCIARPPPDDVGSETSTTTLYDLRMTQFGLAPNDEEAAAKLAGAAPDENDRNLRITLVICAQVPVLQASDTEDETYRNKQELALLMYHLRRFAASIKAHLCFVGEPTDDPDEQPMIELTQLAFVLRELALGKRLDLNAPELALDNESAYYLVYTPQNHSEELLDVLLRNAHNPGQWDAAHQSLWKIFPPAEGEASLDIASKSPGKNKAGDEGWLKELRDSMAIGNIKTPPPKANQHATPVASKQKTPLEKQQTPDVTGFFEGLLK